MSEPASGERAAKLIARAGVCSRREAEVLIQAGRVAINGDVLQTPAVRVLPGQQITIDGERLPDNEPVRLFRFHKPTGMLTASKDQRGRRTITDALDPKLPRLMPIGRLDLNSEGLLLLTNDGELKRRLELPSTGWLRRYKVRAYGRIVQADLDRLEEGIEVDGIRYGKITATLERQQGSNAWMTVALREGRNREVRKALAYLKLEVNRLIRLAYGPFQLGTLKVGECEELRGKILREQLGGLLDGLQLPARQQLTLRRTRTE